MLRIDAPDFDEEWKYIKENYLDNAKKDADIITKQLRRKKNFKRCHFIVMLLFLTLGILLIFVPKLPFCNPQGLAMVMFVIAMLLAFCFLEYVGTTSLPGKEITRIGKILAQELDTLEKCETFEEIEQVYDNLLETINDGKKEWLDRGVLSFCAKTAKLHQVYFLATNTILNHSYVHDTKFTDHAELLVDISGKKGTVCELKFLFECSVNRLVDCDTLVWVDHEPHLLRKYTCA